MTVSHTAEFGPSQAWTSPGYGTLPVNNCACGAVPTLRVTVVELLIGKSKTLPYCLDCSATLVSWVSEQHLAGRRRMQVTIGAW